MRQFTAKQAFLCHTLMLGSLILSCDALANDHVIEVKVSEDDPATSEQQLPTGKELICFRMPDNTTHWNINEKIIREFKELEFGPKRSKDEPAPSKVARTNGTGCAQEYPIDYPIGDLYLGGGDKVIFEVQFSQEGEDAVHQKSYIFFKPKKGEVRVGVGAFFIYTDSKNFFSQASGDAFSIQSRAGDDFDLDMAVTANWIRYKENRYGMTHGFMAGIGADAENLSVFVGYGWTFYRAWTLNLGVAAYQEKRLLSNYQVGQEVPEAIDSAALTTDEYQFAPFFGLSWTPPKRN